MGYGSTKPIHNNYQSQGTTGAVGAFTAVEETADKAFQNYQAQGTTGAVGSFSEMGFQMLVVSTTEVNEEESLGLTDEVVVNIQLLVEESLELVDEEFTSQLTESEESLELVDEVSMAVDMSVEESLGLLDEATLDALLSEEDAFGLADSVSIIVDFDISDTLAVKIYEDFDIKSTLRLDVDIPEITPSAILDSASNTLDPTVILNGSYVEQGVTTDPGTTSTDFIGIRNIIDGVDPCDIWQFNMNLTYEGGTFSVGTAVEIGDLFDTLTILGIPCFITRVREVLSNNSVGYVTRGIVGFPGMHKQLVFAAQGHENLTFVLPNQRLVVTGSEHWTNCETAARSIASLADITLRWKVRNFPLTDFLPEGGMSVLQAISSMAQRAGGVVRFNGIDAYEVVYPDVAYAEWIVPSCRLVGPAGIGRERVADIETGVTDTGVQLVSQPFTYNRFRSPLPSEVKTPPANSPAVQMIGKNKKRLQETDPADVYDLPVNFDKVYIQHLTAQHTNGSTAIPGVNFCTTDPSVWFELSQYDGYVFWSNIGGVYIPQVQIDETLYPEENEDITGNHFVTTLSCTLKSRPTGSQDEQQSKEREAVGYNQETYRFTTSRELSIETALFGAVPIPGMCVGTPNYGKPGTAITGGFTMGPNDLVNYPNQYPIEINGIISNVSISLPGYVTVELGKTKRLRMVEPISKETAQ